MSDFSEMEALGEEQVRLKLSSLEWEGTQALRARHWLELRNSAKADEALEISRSQANAAWRAARYAMYAAIIAAIAALAANREAIFEIIKKLLTIA